MFPDFLVAFLRTLIKSFLSQWSSINFYFSLEYTVFIPVYIMYMYYILYICNMYMCNYRFYGDLSIQKNITIRGTWMCR